MTLGNPKIPRSGNQHWQIVANLTAEEHINTANAYYGMDIYQASRTGLLV